MALMSARQVEPRRDVAELVGGEDAQREADPGAEEDWARDEPDLGPDGIIGLDATLDLVTIPALPTERLLLHPWQVALSRGSV
jgi:hypothetical protein